MRWVEDPTSGRWYIVQDDGSTRWPTPQEEAQRQAGLEPPRPMPQPMPQPMPPSPGGPGAAAGPAGAVRAPYRTNPLLVVAAALAGLFLGLVGGFVIGVARGGLPGFAITPGAADDVPSGAATEPSPDAAAGDRPSPGDDATSPGFGRTVTFDDGSDLTCAEPVPFERAGYAVGGEGAAAFLKVRCTFRNRSGEAFEPIGTMVGMSAGGEQADQVFQDGFDLLTNPVLDGRSVSWWSGFGVVSTQDVQVTVKVGFLDYETVTFS